MNMEDNIIVELGLRSYPIRIGTGIIRQLGLFVKQQTGASRCVLVSESNVAPLYAEKAMQSLTSASIEAELVEFPAGESNKNIKIFSQILDSIFAINPPIDRKTVIVALGGGVCGDMAGYAAASCLRGLRWIQCPTTLLAAVDASVGGKTGINHKTGKNLIGAFHQPSGVLMDVETLQTLPTEELKNGLAESVKHAAIRDFSLLGFINDNSEMIISAQSNIMIELIARNVRIKAEFVSKDERESSIRAHLNFGHTTAHAIETIAGYGTVGHGQAVAYGMLVACKLAEDKNLVSPNIRQCLVETLKKLEISTEYPGLNFKEVWKLMQHDKKNLDQKVRMVLPTAEGLVEIYDNITETEIEQAIKVLES